MSRKERERGGSGGGDGGGGENTKPIGALVLSVPLSGCSIQDELFGSFEQLLALADAKGSTYDRYEKEKDGEEEE